MLRKLEGGKALGYHSNDSSARKRQPLQFKHVTAAHVAVVVVVVVVVVS